MLHRHTHTWIYEYINHTHTHKHTYTLSKMKKKILMEFNVFRNWLFLNDPYEMIQRATEHIKQKKI